MIGRRHDKSKPMMMMMIMLNQTELKKNISFGSSFINQKSKIKKEKKWGKRKKQNFERQNHQPTIYISHTLSETYRQNVWK